MADATVRDPFVWHELMTTDTKSAAGFFTKVVGWQTQVSAHDPSITMFVVKGRPMATLMLLPEAAKAMGAPPSWLTYIGTPDVDATARQAATLGGKILKPPADIPTVGRFAVIQDPQGAVFAAFMPAPGSQRDAAPIVGDFSWHELATTDWRAALTFYQRLFGWEETRSMDMGPEMGTYQVYGWKGKTLGGMFNKPKQMPGPPSWLPYIRVPDSKKTALTVKKAGGQIISGPMEVPGGDWIAQGLDLQGAMFAVHSLKPAAAKKAAGKKPAKKKSARKKVAKKKVAGKTAGKKKAARARTRRGAIKKVRRRTAKKKKAPKRRRR